MISDESSSDSETGRFKGRTKKEDETKSSQNDSRFGKSFGRSRPSDNERFRRDIEKTRHERDRFSQRSRERNRFSRHSPERRRYSKDRSPHRRSRERDRPRYPLESGPRSKAREQRSNSRDKRRRSRSRSRRSQENKRDLKEELRRHLKEEIRPIQPEKEKIIEKPEREKIIEKHEKEKIIEKHEREKIIEKHEREKIIEKREREKIIEKPKRDPTISPERREKKSEIHKPTEAATSQKKGHESPIAIEHDSDASEEVQPGSYYSMIPAVIKEKIDEPPKPIEIKEKSEESSEIDSSDDERLRAKLLNLERELHKTRKKKHKKKHKKKSSKSNKEREREPSAVEVTSTTDIDKSEVANAQTETTEVTSTQKKETSEEGEISSDDDSQQGFEIDPTDLRHKLKRSKVGTSNERDSDKAETCGPALPPHLRNRSDRSKSRDIEGPALPPHLQNKPKNIGPSIPEDMRKVLSEREYDEAEVKYVSSDEDVGIGPLPSGAEEKWSDAHKSLEERALNMKLKQLDGHSLQKSDVKTREQWMLELPDGKAKYLGLEARSFRAKEGPDMSDRSSWTDTPEEKALKAAGIAKEEDAETALVREAKARHITTRDEEQEKAVKKHKKKHKREESLLELHQKKLKKKKKKEEKDEEKPGRRPFSRDVDLQVNRFDEAQKKSIIKKAQDLNTRFSRGDAKFL